MTTPENEPDPVDQLADEAAAETLEYPEGAPELLPVLALPRMRRADAYEVLGHIQDQQRQVKQLERDDDDLAAEGSESDEQDEDAELKPVELDPLSYGAQYRVVAYIEQYLGVVAKSPKAYASWAAGVSDADLVKTFNVYMRKAQPGEADSSTS